MTRRVRVLGSGRAGGSFAGALRSVGWDVEEFDARDPGLPHAGGGVDLALICVSDAAVAEVSHRIRPSPGVVVAHVAGSLGLEVVASHPRHAALHPLVPLPAPDVGAARLVAGATFAVAGDPMVREVVADLGGVAIDVPDSSRVNYHAAACIASNHLVALLGQAERVAGAAGIPLSIYLDLVRATVDNVAALGPRAAVTGPAARADWQTVEAHLAAIDPGERAAYRAMVDLVRRLVVDGPAPPWSRDSGGHPG